MLQVLLEGFSVEELLKLPDPDFAKLNFHNQPLAFKAGNNTIIAQFILTPDALALEVNHLDRGSEGSLSVIASLAARYALREKRAFIDWRLPLLNCVNVNPKLRLVLERREFKIRNTSNPATGAFFFKRVPQSQPWPASTDKSDAPKSNPKRRK
jgi:hypothetical protein